MKLKKTTWLELTVAVKDAADALGRLSEKEAKRRAVLAICVLFDLIPRSPTTPPTRKARRRP